MKKKSQHNSVSEMVRSVSENPTFADKFADRLERRQLVKLLAVLRARACLSQSELAEKLGCTQSKISKLESSDDADVGFGDLLAYTGAVEHEMRIFLVPKGQPIIDEVKMHAFVIKRLLNRLVELAGNDRAIVAGVEKFLVEAAFNLGRFIGSAAAKLPALAEASPSPLQVEAPEMEEDLPEANEDSHCATDAETAIDR